MKERPILFSAEMVRAILDGRKTQTRRAVKPQPTMHKDEELSIGRWETKNTLLEWDDSYPDEPTVGMAGHCPYGVPGDRLWVRETWAGVVPGGNFDEITGPPRRWEPAMKTRHSCRYAADREALWDAPTDIRGYKWRPSIHMPRWASRITLEIADVRVERLQDITDEDIAAEGVQIPASPEGRPLLNLTASPGPLDYMTCEESKDLRNWPRPHFAALWDSLNGDKDGCSWDDSPWVWALSFRRSEA